MGFFKAYDMRGTFGVDFDLDTVYRVGKALPKVVGGGRWLVGHDCRETSPAVRDALVRGLAEAGVEVTDIGEGKYTFTMPACKVTVTAEFKAATPTGEPTGE